MEYRKTQENSIDRHVAHDFVTLSTFVTNLVIEWKLEKYNMNTVQCLFCWFKSSDLNR
jgi:hypothetical protein